VVSAGSIRNYAEVSDSDQSDPDSTPDNGNGTSPNEDDEDTATVTTVSTDIDLELDIDIDPNSTTEGGYAVVTITVTNTSSNPASGVVVNSQLPGCADYDSDNSGGTYDPSTGDWDIGFIPAGGTVEIEITVQVDCEFDVCAEVASANENDIDSTPGNGINSEDDSDCDDIDIEEDDCRPPFGPDSITEGCVDPVTPIQVCIPVTDPQGGDITIVDVDHTFNCAIEIDGGTCFTFTALPGYEGEAVVTVTYCNDCSPALCGTMDVIFEVNCEEEEEGNIPPVGPDKIDLGTIPPVTPTEVCIDFSDPDGDYVEITTLETLFDCSLEQTSANCFTFVALPGQTGPIQIEVTYCDDGDPELCTTTLVNVTIGEGREQPELPGENPNTEATCSAAANDMATTFSNVSVTTNVISNDVGTELDLVDVSTPQNGEVYIVNGEVMYMPTAGYTGMDCFDYTVLCSNGARSTAQLCVNVRVNDAPQFETETLQQSINTGGEITVCLNAIDPNNDNIVYNVVELPALGSFAIDYNNCLVYTGGTSTGSDEIIVEACDIYGNCDQLTIAITIANENMSPYFVDENYEPTTSVQQTVENITSLNYCISAFDPEGGDITLVIVDAPINGEASIDENNCIEYQANENHVGIDVITVEACDGEGLCETLEIVIDVTEAIAQQNAAPVAIDDFFTTAHGNFVELTATVLENDSDIDFDELTIVEVSTQPENGTVEILGDVIVYIPNSGFVGEDSFQYVIEDGSGSRATATVYVTVDQGIIANLDQVTTDVDTAIEIDVTGNDLGDNLQATSIHISAQDGQLSVQADGTILYVPNDGFVGNDSFTYIVEDGTGNNAYGVVEVVVVEEVDCMPKLPNAFSPNRDGRNDTYVINMPEGCLDSTPEVQIFNRWGNKVYYSENYGENGFWDGTWDETNKDLPEGTYFYVIVFNKGSEDEVVRKGYIEIRR